MDKKRGVKLFVLLVLFLVSFSYVLAIDSVSNNFALWANSRMTW